MPTALTRRDFLTTSTTAAAFLATRPALAQTSDPTDLTIAEAQRLIRRRDLSPLDLVEAYVARIRRLDSRLNAYVTVTEERAVERARALEADLAGGRWRGPLHGIPIGLKDNIDTAGVRTTAGSAVYADRVPAEDAEVVTRLEAAGAIVLGKLNLHEFAYGGTSAFTLSGPVRNPWDVDRIPGGLVGRLGRGGRGAAVRRRPRHRHRGVGAHPGRALRHRRPEGDLRAGEHSRHRSPQRLARPRRPDVPVGRRRRPDAAGDGRLRPGGHRQHRGRDSRLRGRAPAADVGAAPRRAAGVLRGRGPAGPGRGRGGARRPRRSHGGARETWSCRRCRRSAPSGVEAYAYHAEILEERRELYDESTLARIEGGAEMSAADYAEARYQLALVRKAIAAVFDDVDVLVTPTLVELPVSIEAARATPREATATLIRNTAPFNGYGTPAISVPCGFSREGLPIGLQLCGPALGEVDVLALAHAYEQATAWHERTPPL